MTLTNNTKSDNKPQFFVATLNARLQPIHRGEIYEDPLADILIQANLGDVTGGGTSLNNDGEVDYCDIEIQVSDSSAGSAAAVISALNKLGVPKGSKLTIEATDEVMQFGELEGLAIYLNGTDLPAEVYQTSDVNHVYSELDRLTKGTGGVYSYWQGPSETAFYLYGTSFEVMKQQISELVEQYPLCQKARVERVA